MPPDELALDRFRALAADAGFDADDPHLADLYPSVVALREVLDKLREPSSSSDEEPALIFRPGPTP